MTFLIQSLFVGKREICVPTYMCVLVCMPPGKEARKKSEKGRQEGSQGRWELLLLLFLKIFLEEMEHGPNDRIFNLNLNKFLEIKK